MMKNSNPASDQTHLMSGVKIVSSSLTFCSWITYRFSHTCHGHEEDKSLATPQQILDFKGEAITFKATTAGILATITHCIDLMQQREDSWRKKLEIESEKRKKLEDILKQGSTNESAISSKSTLGPDYEEGPHTKIKEEEFFDALDAMLDKHDKQAEEKRILKIRVKEIGEPSASLPVPVDHQLWPEIEKVTMDQLYYARLEVGEGDAADPAGWNLFAEEGEMRLYRREVEIDGLVCDPLKAVHTVKGVTGHEMCYHFFSPDVRWDWENTLESMKVVEEVNPNTLVFHQIHKRVWPAAQRDAVFWSHIRKVQDLPLPDSNLTDVWIVCNKSCDYHDIPVSTLTHNLKLFPTLISDPDNCS
jgi:collagen type IV alpha-3-binding protein